ncbi:type II toxin-antitoxin system Phd/YefM family antitoxin [Candidatus Daviesbacteria bacterium]|nr:type II toxin-antitoxin system Phd/YefM family antitoxin [Candidatus Daviesbacteria bacterium]
MNGSLSKIIPITELRRNFGKISKNLAKTDTVILTKGGKPFALLKAAPEEKRKLLAKVAGVWKEGPLDNDILWKKGLKKKSRKSPISL